ncbi:MAG: GNAT family N-acetyltransferase [Pseudomonadota bacterium]
MLSIDKADYSVQVVRSFDFCGDDYFELFERSRAYAFQHPNWLDAFYRHMAPGRGAEPFVLSIRLAADGMLHCVLPLILRRKAGLRLLETTDLGVSDYACPVALPEFWPELERNKVLQSQILKALPRHDLLRIRPVREEDCGHFRLLLGCEPKPLDFFAHAVELGQPYADWRKTAFNGSLRKMIDRKKRKLLREHEGVVLERLTETGAVSAAIAELARLRAGRFNGDVIDQEFALRFYQDVAQEGAREGLAETWRLTADGGLRGVVFGLTHEGRFYYLLIGCDYDNSGQYSPGLQLYDGIMEQQARKRDASFDFTIGDEDFKLKFGTVATPMHVFIKAGSILGVAAKRILESRLGT